MRLFENVLSEEYPDFTKNGTPVCATTDPEIFFPERDGKGFNKYAITEAKKMCNSCPYKLACLIWATDNREIGIWGGMTAKERRAYRKLRIKSLENRHDKI